MKKKAKPIRFRVDDLLQRPGSLAEKLHEQTKIKQASKNLPTEKWPEEWIKIYYKAYVRLAEIKLPKPAKIDNVSLHQAFSQRQSKRTFSRTKLSLDTLSTVLYYAAGEKDMDVKQRFYPSAGGRYPLEVYLISRSTELPQGMYHYYVRNHSLEVLEQKPIRNLQRYFTYPWMKDASCVIVITAIFDRNFVKYADRGYRYIHLEAGHMSQNVYLTCSSLNINCCAMGGYIDDKINNLLDLDGLKESTIHTLALG